MAAPDHLFILRNNFYLGAYQAAINSSDIPNLPVEDAVERDSLVYRSYIALGSYQLVISEIDDSAATPLQAVKLLALYLFSPGSNESVISSLKDWLADSAIANNTILRLIAGIIFMHEEDYNEALKHTNAGGTMELHALNVQMFLKMHRSDHAERQLRIMQQIDEDHILTQLATAWLNLSVGGSKIQEAYLIFQDFSEKYPMTGLILNGKAICCIHMGNFDEAETLLLEALNKDAKDPETLANLVVCSLHLGATDKEEMNFSDEDPIKDDKTGYLNEETSESESESDEEHIKLSEPSKNAIFNKEGMNDKLQDISWLENVGWIHRLSIDIDQEQKVDVNDDLNRELSFYTQALEGTRRAYGELESKGLPFLRPSDYYAEMVKSDVHMEKVKGRLLAERKNIEEAEERKKAREAKRIAKAVQAQKLKERAAQKKNEIEAVKKFRKQRQQSGFSDKVGDMDLPFDEGKGFERSSKKRPGVVAPGDRTGGKGRRPQKGGKKGLDKRQRKDSKFGSGGRKGLKRQNTADSTNDFRGFNKGDSRGNKRAKLK